MACTTNVPDSKSPQPAESRRTVPTGTSAEPLRPSATPSRPSAPANRQCLLGDRWSSRSRWWHGFQSSDERFHERSRRDYGFEGNTSTWNPYVLNLIFTFVVLSYQVNQMRIISHGRKALRNGDVTPVFHSTVVFRNQNEVDLENQSSRVNIQEDLSETDFTKK